MDMDLTQLLIQDIILHTLLNILNMLQVHTIQQQEDHNILISTLLLQITTITITIKEDGVSKVVTKTLIWKNHTEDHGEKSNEKNTILLKFKHIT